MIGEPGASIEAENPPPPPPPRQGPRMIRPAELAAHRIVGETRVVPDDDTQSAMRRAGTTRLVGIAEVCVDASGEVSQISLRRSCGFDAYDRTVQAALSAWAFRPYVVDGDPTPVCSVVTFLFTLP
jgi:protein TonB